MTSQLCDTCAAIPWYDLLQTAVRAKGQGKPEKWREHHEDGRALVEAADTCGICKMIYQALHMDLLPQLLESSSPSVRGVRQIKATVKLERCVPNGWRHSYPVAYAIAQFHCKIATGWFWGFSTQDAPVTLRMNIQNGDELRSKVMGRFVDPDPISYAALQTMQLWISDCDHKHPACSKLREHSPFTSPILPSRLISIGEQNDPFVKVILTPHGAQYIALSHCWGRSQSFVTNARNLASRMASIRVAEMPKTFSDAIRITRRLGLRYLWIDSLCIVQDERQDWEIESAKMGSIYRWAWLVIAASNASSDIQGFLHRRDTDRTAVVVEESDTEANIRRVQLRPKPQNMWTHGFGDPLRDEPLTQRGWAVQERYLARRTLFFGTDQMFFECQRNLSAENGDTIRREHSYDSMRFREPIGQEKHATFYQAVGYFSKCSLSRPTDKLPALSGLASKMPWAAADQYIAGIWRKSWVGGLLWSRSSRYARVHRGYRAPFFSWASVDGEVRFVLYETTEGHVEETATLISHNTTLEGKDTYGAVLYACLTITAPVVSVKKHFRHTFHDKARITPRYLDRTFHFAVGGSIISVAGNFDNENVVQCFEQDSLSVCLLAQVMDESNRSVLYEDRVGLVLKEIVEEYTERIVYRRVGVFKGRFEYVQQPAAQSLPEPSSFDEKFDACMTCGLYDYVNSNVRFDGNTDWVSASMPRRTLNLV